MLNNIDRLKAILSLIAFVVAIIIGFIALFLPPQGVIDSSVLFFVAQLLVFVSGLLGINFSIDALSKKAKTHK